MLQPCLVPLQVLRQEFEQLLNIVFSTENAMDKADIQKLRDSGVFGPLTFWVTEIKNLADGDTGKVCCRA